MPPVACSTALAAQRLPRATPAAAAAVEARYRRRRAAARAPFSPLPRYTRALMPPFYDADSRCFRRCR